MAKQIKDLTSKKFGRLTVMKYVGLNKVHASMWECICDCGNTITVEGRSLTTGNTRSCGCFKKDLTSKKFGRLTVLKYVGLNKVHASMWECICDCGNNVTVEGRSLTTGNTRSCGCFKADKDRPRKIYINQRQFIAISPEGVEQILNNQNKFARDNDISIGSIYRCLNNKQKQTKGWKFRYKD